MNNERRKYIADMVQRAKVIQNECEALRMEEMNSRLEMPPGIRDAHNATMSEAAEDSLKWARQAAGELIKALENAAD